MPPEGAGDGGERTARLDQSGQTPLYWKEPAEGNGWIGHLAGSLSESEEWRL